VAHSELHGINTYSSTLRGFSIGGQFDIMPKIGGFMEGLPAQIIESWSQSRGVLFAALSIITNTILSIP
jgi:hypothetical protein